jgi:hypothetical protein
VKKTKVATKANVVRTSIKVLKNGQSWHGGNHKWSLPELIDNTWKPGAWTSAINPVWCESGWHLTNNPVAWWDDGEGVVAYLVEYEGATAGPDLTASDDPTKFAVERCRLLRPLTSAELAEKGIFLAGELDELKDGRYILGGDAHVRSLNGSARVDLMYGSARVESMDGSASVESMYGSASVGSMYGSATVHASGDAIVVVRRGSPIVTLRGRASCVDYRTVKPMFHVADEDKVLTLTGDSTTSPSDPK